MKDIYVYADWIGLAGPTLIGILKTEPVRGKEVFSYSYYKSWLETDLKFLIDPDLQYYTGPQYLREEKINLAFLQIRRRTDGVAC